MSRRALAASLLLLLPALAAGAGDADADADARFAATWHAEWTWRLAQFPQLATAVGEHQHDDRLGEAGEAAQQARRRHWESVRRALAAIDVDALSPAARIDFAIFRDQVESSAENIRLGGHRMPLNSDSAFWSDLAFLPRQHPVRDVADVERYIARLRAVPAYFDQHIELLREGLRRGQTVPRVTLEGREASIAAQAKVDDVEASPFYAPLRRLPASIGAEDAACLRTQAAAAIRESVAPAYAKLLAFMRDTYILGARTTLGASALPDGKAYYRRQIIDFVTEDLDPREIHATGLAEVARLRAAMEAIIREIEFDGDYAAFLHHLRTDPRYYAKSPDELLAQAAWIAKRADGALPRFFGRLPRRPYGVQAVPEAIAPYYTAGRYVPASEGSTEPGWYWVNTYGLPGRPLYTLPALTLHEAVPGHHLQIALAAESGEQPPFRRYAYISAYGEGWALYAEELGHEMGIYRTPHERFGQLTYAMWRANRLVVDTGVHALGWTREQAIAYMTENTALSEHEIRTEVDRYISWPGQALSYYLGMLRIKALRAEAERELGPRFDLRAFHDAVLETGSVPLPVLSDHVRGWIAARKAAD
ncbi:MAG: DUF885 domain-containing protein [Xanthomonadaceae bacterium]|jgi:uncharacterized protein (DUF885 family)|nr:DUF885 domain-containing protein [Xanthomonadaceae bacterium]